jgi:hypothetical protein
MCSAFSYRRRGETHGNHHGTGSIARVSHDRRRHGGSHTSSAARVLRADDEQLSAVAARVQGADQSHLFAAETVGDLAHPRVFHESKNEVVCSGIGALRPIARRTQSKTWHRVRTLCKT